MLYLYALWMMELILWSLIANEVSVVLALRAFFDAQSVADQRNKLPIRRLIIQTAHIPPERLVKRFDSSPVPRHFDRVPDCALHLA